MTGQSHDIEGLDRG